MAWYWWVLLILYATGFFFNAGMNVESGRVGAGRVLWRAFMWPARFAVLFWRE